MPMYEITTQKRGSKKIVSRGTFQAKNGTAALRQGYGVNAPKGKRVVTTKRGTTIKARPVKNS